jgi:hypothetical protein
MIDAQQRRQTGHYGDAGENVTDEEAHESFEWTGEFIEAAKEYLEA